MSAKTKAVNDIIGQVQADVDGLRDRLAELQDERRRVEEMPVDAAEAARRIEALIEDRQARAWLEPYGMFTADEREFDPNRFAAKLGNDPLAVLATCFPEQLRTALRAYVPEHGISEEARSARIAQIDVDLETTAVAEEVALRELEEALRIEMPRREDGPPRLLIAAAPGEGAIDPARVERYRVASEGAFAAARRALEEAMMGAENLAFIEGEARRIQQVERGDVRPDMAERIEKAKAEVARLRKVQAATSERSQSAGRIWSAIEDHLKLDGRPTLIPAPLPGGKVSA